MNHLIPLGDVCQIIGGGTPTKKNFSFYMGKIPWATVRDMTSQYLSKTEFSITDDAVRNSATNIIPQGEIVISTHVGLGKVCILEQDTAINQDLKAIIPTRDICREYLYFWFVSIAKLIKANGKGATVKGVTLDFVKKLQFPLRNRNEQDNIAKKMSIISSLIALREKQLQRFAQLAKSRFIEMFGDPVENPKKWEKTPLGRNVTLQNGRAYSQNELLDTGKYPVLRVGNFFSNRGWYYSNMELEPEKYCDNGDLLYAWSASFGPKIWDGGKVIYHYHIWKVGIKGAYNKAFLCKLLEHMTSLMMKETHGIAMMHLTKSGMEQTLFILPPISLQNEFATFIEQLDKSKVTIRQSLEKLNLTYRALLQEYFG